MDSNATNENTLRLAAYGVAIVCAAVFIVRIAMYAIPLLTAFAK